MIRSIGKRIYNINSFQYVLHQALFSERRYVFNIKYVNKSTCPTLTAVKANKNVEVSDKIVEEHVIQGLTLVEDFVNEQEEQLLFNEVEKYLRKLRYEFDHWDNAIHGFRETEKTSWSTENMAVLDRLRSTAFPPGTPQLAHVHVLDLDKDGFIKPHIDSIRFCGSTIAGICLLSPCVMKFVQDKDDSKIAQCLLPRRGLYVMKDAIRYEYTHEVLKDEDSYFQGSHVPKDRRISIICRNEVDPEKVKDS